MQLVHCNPNTLQNRRHNQSVNFFDNLFDDFFGPVFHPASTPGKSGDKNLRVDIYEKENIIVIEADLPGIAREDIKLDVKGKLLTLGGERKRSEEIQDEHRFRQERSFGTVERSFSLPFEIDAETVTAKLENGILRLEIPKPEEKKSKQITIN